MSAAASAGKAESRKFTSGHLAASVSGMDRKGLGCSCGKRLGKPFEWTSWIEPVWWLIGLTVDCGGVEPCFEAGAGERDVAPLFLVAVPVGEHEGTLEGQSLCLVTGDRIRLPNLTRLQIRAREQDTLAVVDGELDRASTPIERHDRAAGAVADTQTRVVAATEDPVPERQLGAIGKPETLSAKQVFGVENRSCGGV